jgi:hypothetical protein
MKDAKPRGAMLVGSVPLSDAEEVMSTVSSVLGSHLRRIPDGETGARKNWIRWQQPLLSNLPFFEAIPPEPGHYAEYPRVRLRPDTDPKSLSFGALGYSEAAQASYAVFKRLKKAGVIPKKMRFQVSLPTPLAVVNRFVHPDSQAAVEQPYERRMLAELKEICAAIPADDLSVQWDVAVELALLEGVWTSHLGNVRGGVIDRLVRLGNAVAGPVELGYHLCYGDFGRKRFAEPADAGLLVEVANKLSAGVHHPIHWIHMPVPRERSDEAFFAPLSHLSLKPGTELYLGLIHATDGAEGARARIQAALKSSPEFGVATECGMGRRPPETLPALLALHAEVAEPV